MACAYRARLVNKLETTSRLTVSTLPGTIPPRKGVTYATEGSALRALLGGCSGWVGNDRWGGKSTWEMTIKTPRKNSIAGRRLIAPLSDRVKR